MNGTDAGMNAAAPPGGAPGQPTLGRYRLVREIARSNDIVWEGIDPTMNRPVAVKELALPATLTGEARRNRIERFYREARAAGAMSHPNIVTIHEVGEDNGRFFIAMELLAGQTLRERLSVGGALPLSEAIRIAIALAEALDYAHAHGVVHRDIKPENVHLLPDGRVKLTDFGIARITHEEQLTVAGQVFGTPSYMSPEQILGKPIDARSDLFALGVLLYEMVAGRKPFTQPGDSVVTITYRIINDAAPAPVGIPPGVEATLERAMAKSPDDRFQTAAAFRSALQTDAASITGGYSAGGFAPAAAAGAPLGTPPQATAAYGTRTQLGVAPGLAAAQSGSPPYEPPAPRLATPATVPPLQQQTYYPSTAAGAEDRSRRLAASLAFIFFGLAIVIGGGWALSTAYRNYQAEAARTQTTASYAAATKLYSVGQYEEAARAFKALRTSHASDSELVVKSTQGELYSYRQLGHAAQDRGDFRTAVQWYQAAAALDPTDQQAQSELAAAQKRAGGAAAAALASSGSPAPAPSTDGSNPLSSVLSSPTPAPSASAPASVPAVGTQPSVSANDFQQANAQRAQQAWSFYQQGETAYRAGDLSSAKALWGQAVAAGPGSQGALLAGEELRKYGSQLQPY